MNRQFSRSMVATFLSLLPHISNASLPASECHPVKVYYSNGIRTDPADARISFRALEFALRPEIPTQADKYVEFDLAYSPTDGFWADLVEVFDQRLPESADKWFNFFPVALGRLLVRGIETLMEDHLNTVGGRIIAAISRRLLAPGLFDDKTVRDHVDSYTKAMRSGKRVLVVAHSQGSLYANAAFNHMKARPPAGLNLAAFGIAAIGSPASMVATGDGHVNSATDLVIQAVSALGLVGLPLNDTSVPPFPLEDRLGHSFRTIYFNSKYPIRQHVQDVILASLNRVMLSPSTAPISSDFESLAATAPHEGLALTTQMAASGMIFDNLSVFRNDGLPENPLTFFNIPNLPGKVGLASVYNKGSGQVKILQDLRILKVRVASLSCKATVVVRLNSGLEHATQLSGCSGMKMPDISRYVIEVASCKPSDRIEEVRMRADADEAFFLYELTIE